MRQGRNPAATVYESLGANFFLALDPGWLNLGLWEGPGTLEEAPRAVRRLVETLAQDLPRDGVILDVGNGLGAQDPLIARIARPRRLAALNITESQLREGRSRLGEAGALPVVGDATRLPIRSGAIDGVISVEAAFHFRSRRAFFEEVVRVLRPGGVLTMSDVSVERPPPGLLEGLAGFAQLRLWGLRAKNLSSAERIADLARRAGLVDVRMARCGDRVLDPALAAVALRLRDAGEVPPGQRLAARFFLAQVRTLRRREMIDYVLLRARRSTRQDA
ncbi:MAG: methyltransferase domain-containing protein [Actinobacteria bacterium]|nr:methyltransferase domain-containing protein [Actinomycetota bacterium]